uniref:Tyrosinase copper-binding domain-containing protein n=1 Tax=Meloidogyne incognita TaxID=6306 RepID=A0A914MUH6_MELIC
MLSDEQRQAYFKAVQQMKDNGAYNLCAIQHKDAYLLKGAHRGPAFCPWHRELLKRFEILLREAGYQTMETADVCLPYWDSTLERQLPTPKDSLLFTETFIGSTNSNNEVSNGPFSPWQTLEGDGYINRTVGSDGICYREADIEWELDQKNLTYFMAYFSSDYRCQFRIPHGTTHTFIGGHMSDPSIAANDPIFFNHHCFVDLIWELYRWEQQTYAERPVQYPPDIKECELPFHFKESKMITFPFFRNIDGCRNEYTDNMYEYAPRPNCSTYKPDCGSKYLFCDLSNGDPHCAAKVRPGGNCRGFTKGEQVCYNGNCVNNVCVGQQEKATTTTEEPDYEDD